MSTKRHYREYALTMKSEECEICGATENVVVHHIDGDRSNNSLDNLAPVCQEHHAKIHFAHDGVEEYTEKLPEELIRRPDRSVKERKAVSMNADAFQALSEFKREDESWSDFGWRMVSVLESGNGVQNDQPGKRTDEIADEIAEKTVDKMSQRLSLD